MKNNKSLQNKLTIVASILAAILIWIFISIFISPEMDIVIKDVPVTIDISGTIAESSGMQITEGLDTTVSLTVSGDRSTVGNLDADDFMIVPVFGTITSSGEYVLELVATVIDATGEYTIVDMSPSTITLTFDVMESEYFDITIQTPDITIPDGYVSGVATSSISEVEVFGPQEELDKIEKIVAVLTTSGSFTESIEESVKLVALDETGAEITSTKISFAKESVMVTLPILKVKTVALDIEFINVPEGLDTSSIEYNLSLMSIEIAGPEDSINSLETLNVGYVDISEIYVDSEFIFDITLPTSYISIDDVSHVTVDFSKNNFTSETLTITNITTVNVPDGYIATVISTQIQNVEIISSTSTRSISADDFVAEVDFSKITYVNGNGFYKVDIVSSSGKIAWAVGSYSVVINLTQE